MHTITTYRGTRDGWQPVATRPTAAAAAEFCRVLSLVRPLYSHRVEVVA